MISTSNVIILSICVLFCAFRAYKKGLWLTLLSVIAIVIAYVVSFIWGLPFASVLEAAGLNTLLAFPLALLLIFSFTVAFMTYIPPLIFPRMKSMDDRQQKVGAVFGGFMGVLIGLVTIWGFTTASSLLALKANTDDRIPLEFTKEDTDILASAASSLMSNAVRAGVNTVSDDAQKANAAAAFVAAPDEFAFAAQQVAQAPELKEFWLDGEAQFLMAHNDVEGVLANSKFKALMDVPGMQETLLQAVTKEGIVTEHGERYLAENMSYVWRRIRFLRSDPRLVAIVEDPEVKALIEKQNPMSLAANKKIQSLVKIVMEENDMENFDFSQDLESTPVPQKRKAPQQENKNTAPVTIYKWKDDKGKTRYTDLENTPLEKREQAQTITQ